MVPLKLSLLSVFLFILLSNSGNCKNDKDTDQLGKKNDTKQKTEQGPIPDGENYDEIGEAFLSMLSDDLKMKIIKNKAANEGLVDKKQFKKEQLTREELEEVQAALVKAMQPIFGQFINELAEGKDSDGENPELTIEGPEEGDKENEEDKVEGEESKETMSKKSDDKKETTTKKDDKKKEKKDKAEKTKKTEKQQGDQVKSKPGKEETKREEAKKDKKKKMNEEKGEKKAGAGQKGKKKDAKRKEEL